MESHGIYFNRSIHVWIQWPAVKHWFHSANTFWKSHNRYISGGTTVQAENRRQFVVATITEKAVCWTNIPVSFHGAQSLQKRECHLNRVFPFLPYSTLHFPQAWCVPGILFPFDVSLFSFDVPVTHMPGEKSWGTQRHAFRLLRKIQWENPLPISWTIARGR